MRVTDGIRRIIEDWRTKGVSPEETAQSLPIHHGGNGFMGK